MTNYLGRLLLVLFFSSLTLKSAECRDLSTITYYFTTCGSQGRNGPTFEECQSHYQSTDSLLHGKITSHEGFIGGQQFTFPRSGNYGIRIAGAAGGRGVCSTRGGYGTTLSAQVYIEKGFNDTYLIVVGQRGTSPCDTITSFPLCDSPPTNFAEAQVCNSDWQTNYVSYMNTGGGGGGGGSMLWPQNTTGSYSEDILPFIAASGGGGTSLLLSYSSVNDSRIPFEGNETNKQYYNDWINGQPQVEDGLNVNNAGSTGNSPEVISAGFGSGWRLPSNVPPTFKIENEDGKLLSQNVDFAMGGQDCLSGESNSLFSNVSGGFGGGGGGCSEGGGGGGYGGGWVLTKGGDDLPGRGGYSLPGPDTDVLVPNNGDGYVKILPLDCGCSSRQCNINTAEGSFSCVCIDGTRLASNDFNCLTDLDLQSTIDNSPLNEESRTFSNTSFETSLLLFTEAYSIYEAEVRVSRSSSGSRKRETANGNEMPCVVIFVDIDGSPVLASVANSSGQANSLISLSNSSNSSVVLSSLEEGQRVGGVMTMSEETCAISYLLISIDNDDDTNSSSVNITLQEILDTFDTSLETIVAKYLMPQRSQSSSQTTPTNTPIPGTQTGSIVSTNTPDSSVHSSPMMSSTMSPVKSEGVLTTPLIIVIAVVPTVLVILMVLVVLCVLVIVRRRRSRKTIIYQVQNRTATSGSMNGGRSLTRRGTLQKIKTRIMSLTSNPNYGETTIEGNNFTDDSVISLSPPNEKEMSNGSTSDKSNLYESVSLTTSHRSSSFSQSLHGRVGSKKDGSSSLGGVAFRLRSKSRRRVHTLKPKYGVMTPTVDFYDYNSKRTEDDEWDYDRSQLTYMREIGEGQFGKVLLMKAKNIAGFNGKLPVAVKTLTSIDEEDIKKFLEEVDLMKKFCHSNIVSLLGVDSRSSEGAPLMILEYMPYGDLQSFLKRHKPKAVESSLIGQYHHKKFARDVALALSFLSQNKYVHRDVAARNCLVGPSLDVKLADFGMARGVHEKEYYRVAGRAVLPVRWMAPESLLYGLFSSSSDVWSYGVLLWEIVTYGDMPLEKLNPQEIVEMAQMQTLQHHWPAEAVSEELLGIKDQCHLYDHEHRITFEKIIELLPYSTESQAAENG